jgi:hypothetical protein
MRDILQLRRGEELLVGPCLVVVVTVVVVDVVVVISLVVSA